MRTKRNLFTFALGGVAGYLVGRYPRETLEKVRGGAGMTVGLARERIGMMSQALPFARAGDHRAVTTQPPETGDDVVDRTSTAYVSRPHP
ncbi:hypothetical protein SAMN05428985_104142 [Nocardioides sp. YR527]|uniref:hypothetical protein n=1 Tax=Nocardioides sp. YR527 TaxID=1881028 RepID=UPI00088656F4|nr:hypothetical protein [Nocardioides sp. YR527]SDK47333.1 hypothetical protein SAMN05428985_104142 [Nocardioides sp. YR527]